MNRVKRGRGYMSRMWKGNRRRKEMNVHLSERLAWHYHLEMKERIEERERDSYMSDRFLSFMMNTVQYSTVQYSTVQYSTVQCSAVQYST